MTDSKQIEAFKKTFLQTFEMYEGYYKRDGTVYGVMSWVGNEILENNSSSTTIINKDNKEG